MLMLSHFLLSTSALAATSAPAAKLAHAAIVARPIDLCFVSTTAVAGVTAYCRHGHYYPHMAPVPCAIAPAPAAVTRPARAAHFMWTHAQTRQEAGPSRRRTAYDDTPLE